MYAYIEPSSSQGVHYEDVLDRTLAVARDFKNLVIDKIEKDPDFRVSFAGNVAGK